MIWHLPSFSIELGYNLFYAFSYGTFNFINPPQLVMEKLINFHNN